MEDFRDDKLCEVGDMVIVLDGSDLDDYYGGWVGSMESYIGKQFEVCAKSAVDGNGRRLMNADGYDIGFSFDVRRLMVINCIDYEVTDDEFDQIIGL